MSSSSCSTSSCIINLLTKLIHFIYPLPGGLGRTICPGLARKLCSVGGWEGSGPVWAPFSQGGDSRFPVTSPTEEEAPLPSLVWEQLLHTLQGGPSGPTAPFRWDHACVCIWRAPPSVRAPQGFAWRGAAKGPPSDSDVARLGGEKEKAAKTPSGQDRERRAAL